MKLEVTVRISREMHTKRQMHSARSIKMQMPFIRRVMYASGMENQYSD